MNRKYIVLDDVARCDNCGRLMAEGEEVLVAGSQYYFCDSSCYEVWEESRIDEDEMEV
jgi:hypothetical protein